MSIAISYRRYGIPLAELIAEGNFGIVHAIRKYDPERGNRFVTYAAYWIRAYILNHVIHSWSLVGVGSGPLRSKMFFRLRRERARIAGLVGEGEAGDKMLAEKFGAPAEKVIEMAHRLEARDVSLDTKVFEDGARSLVDTLGRRRRGPGGAASRARKRAPCCRRAAHPGRAGTSTRGSGTSWRRG